MLFDQPAARQQDDVPLYVDLDGTLVKTDLLFESFLGRIRADPLVVLKSLWWLAHGRARLKGELAAVHAVNVGALPFNESLLGYLRTEAARGRRLILATACHRKLAEAVASHLGIFSGVIATEQSNLKGANKLAAIRAQLGDAAFDYAGNGAEDRPVFAAARRAIVVDDGPSMRGLWSALRPHQWLKNVLILVPLLTSVSFTSAAAWLQALAAFCAFCALASATYIVNDLLDLEADRAHARKRQRPFAAGTLSPQHGLVVAPALFAAGIALALLLPWDFVLAAAVYFALTIAYSVWLKMRAIADVVTLAGLYTIRVLAGIAAIDVPSSFWLLAFSVFIFFSLALVKRCAELALKTSHGAGPYKVEDLGVLQALGIGSACVAVLVFALYIDSPHVVRRLASPELLWLICPMLLYWLGRMWLIAARGRMQDDPVVFAATDPTSVLVGALTVAFFVAAAVVQHPF